MSSTFAGIEIGKRSLIANTVALTTIGHNLSNAARPGYSRQRVELQAMSPIYRPQLNRAERPGQIGQGVEVASVDRVRDDLLERRIVAQNEIEGYWRTRDRYMLMLEQVYNEPTEQSIRNLVDQFWDGFQELSIFPDQLAAREVVLQRGEALANGIRGRYQQLEEIRAMIEDDILVRVDQVNALTTEIAALNTEIERVQALQDNPNDLLDRRDELAEELGNLINITVDRRDPDEYLIHTDGVHLVQGGIARQLQAEPAPINDGFVDISFADTGDPVSFRGGILGSLVELRDVDVRGEIQSLDNLTVNLADLVNELHRSGAGLDGGSGRDFFVELPFVEARNGQTDTDADGVVDSTFLFRVSGINALDPQAQIGVQGVMTFAGSDTDVEIPYFPTDTVSELVRRINTSGAEVVARLDLEGRLTLKATPAADIERPDFVLRRIEDSGQFLVGYAGLLQESGPAGAFTSDNPTAVADTLQADLDLVAVAPESHPAGWIGVNPLLRQQPQAVAAGTAGESGRAADGDGSIALAVSALRSDTVMLGSSATFDDYFADTVARVGVRGEEARQAFETQEFVMKDLRDTRAALSGVNIDEELSEMIKFQQGYAAAARFVTVMDGLIETVINRLGSG